MARYQVQGPDGQMHVIEGPDGAMPDQVIAAAQATIPSAKAAGYNAAAQDATFSPTNGMSGFDKFMAGAGKAVADTGRGIGQLVGSGLDAVSSPTQTMSGLVLGSKPQTLSQRLGLTQGTDVAEQRKLDAPLMDTGMGMAGNVTGNVAMMLAPGGAVKGVASAANAARGAVGAVNASRLGMAANALDAVGGSMMAPTTLKGAAALGAASGAVQPVVDNSERATNAAIGGAGGVIGQSAFNALARVVRPNTSAAVQGLMDQGITPTPGQILGGGFKRAEEGLTSVPILGDFIKGAQGRAVADLNTAAFNRALTPIGETLPKGLQGREAVQYVGDTLGKRYDALLPNLTTQADAPFMSEVMNLRNMMANGSIDPAKASQFESILQNQVLSKFQTGANGAPTLTGQTMKGIETDLGQLSSKFQRSLDPDQQMVGDALQEVQASLRGAVQRSNPAQAPELAKINEGWANFKRVQKAAAGLGAEDGAFGAAQLQNAVKATDRSKDKGAFASGNALMQDLSEPAKAVLGPKVPDSGTPYRSLAALLAGGAAAHMAIGPGAAAAVAAGPALYSKAGQNALAALLASRPAAAEPVANALRRIGPYATAPVANLLGQ